MEPSKFYAENSKRFLTEIFEILKIKSISTDPECKADVKKAAEWFGKKLETIGLDEVKLLTKGSGNPVVFAQKIFDPTLPTLLLYGHYDVQPVGDLPEWESDPFEPVLRDNAIFARGATDDKAQLLTNIFALEYYLQHQKVKTWNIKIALEGEEEIGGDSIEAMIADNEFNDYFSADYVYISDGPWAKFEVPSVEFALRGIVYFDLEIRSAKSDMHSGIYGNAVLNPANLAGHIVYKLKDIIANKIRIPNIYKQVRKSNEEEVKMISAASNSWEEVVRDSGTFVTTPIYKNKNTPSPVYLTGMKPSLDIHGISTGFVEKGQMKTAIPATALIKFSLRLVPNMDPDETVRITEKYIKSLLPKGVEYKLTCINKNKAYITDPKDVKVQNLMKALEVGFGHKAALLPSGGSIGLVTSLAEKFGMIALNASYGLPDDRLHGPNEKFNLSQLEGGFKTLCEFLKN